MGRGAREKALQLLREVCYVQPSVCLAPLCKTPYSTVSLAIGCAIIRLIALQVPRLSQSNVRALPAVVGVERPNSAKVTTVRNCSSQSVLRCTLPDFTDCTAGE